MNQGQLCTLLVRFKLGNNLDTFTSLSLKDRLLSKKISGISEKRKLDTRSGITGKSMSENLERMIQPESKKMKPKMSSRKQSQEVPTVTPQKGVNKLELHPQAFQCKEHEQKVAATSKSARSTPMKTPEESIGISDASLSAKRNETSPHVLGLKMGCTFSKGVAPQWSLRLVRRQKDDVGNIDVDKTSQSKTGKWLQWS